MKSSEIQTPKRSPNRSVRTLWFSAIERMRPSELLETPAFRRVIHPAVNKDTAFLFWGKAARATQEVFDRGIGMKFAPRLVISPENSDHPIPGRRSFKAGLRLLNYFEELGRSRKKHLAVFLSGGASSLAWVKSDESMSEKELGQKLEALYRQPLSIQKLNRERAKLCRLKAGGAARALKRLAPKIQAKVFVLSDVAPFGMEVVGSGPFIGAGFPHQLLADNRALVRAAVGLVKKSRSTGDLSRARMIDVQHSKQGSERGWAKELSKMLHVELRSTRARSDTGMIIWGGEPVVSLPFQKPRQKSQRKIGRGGRQCQIAARLALEFWDEIREGRMEILCGSSDGSDGNSGAAAIHLRRTRRMKPLNASLQRQLEKAVREFNTAPFLRKRGFVIPSFRSFTNLQDLIVIQVVRPR